jgi:hypothetical protein
MKRTILLLSSFIFSCTVFSQRQLPVKPAQVTAFSPVSFAAISRDAAAGLESAKAKPVTGNNTYSAKGDTSINTPAKINRRVPGFKEVPSAGPGLPRRQAALQSASIQQRENALSGVCLGYEALEDFGTSYPPDVSAAGGFDHTMITLNQAVRIKNKDGSNVSTVTLQNFIASTGETDAFDPKVFYDHHNNQWIMMCCVARRSSGSGFVIGMSATADPTSNWFFVKVDGDAADTLWYDYPSVGFTYDKIVVTGNMFTNVGDLGYGGRMWVIDKSALASFNAPTVVQVDNINFTTHPAITFGNGGTCYAVAVQDGSLAQLELYSVSGAIGGLSVTDHGVVDYGSGNGWAGGLGNVLPQKGTAAKIDAGDERMLSVVYRNGKIWWANNFYWPLAAPTYCGVQYGIFNPVTRATIDFAGIWNNTSNQYAYPNIMVNDNEDMGISFGAFTTTSYASAAYGFVNGGQTLGNLAWNISRAGDSTYFITFGGRTRWGDYFGIGLDPTDGKSMWLTGQYAASRTSGIGRYGTYTVKLCGTCSPTVTTSTALTNAVRKFEATTNINASNLILQNSKIKYDAGSHVILSPGFRAASGTDVRVFIEGCGGIN